MHQNLPTRGLEPRAVLVLPPFGRIRALNGRREWRPDRRRDRSRELRDIVLAVALAVLLGGAIVIRAQPQTLAEGGEAEGAPATGPPAAVLTDPFGP